jgi:nitroreductase
MDLKDAIEKRRAYRSLEPVEITEDLVEDLARCAQLAPSCFNNQPARFVFVYDPDVLEPLKTALSRGNAWAGAASMIIAVFSHKESDCVIQPRVYYLFDTGLATAFLILRATALGLVAHPIAGYKEGMAKEILGIPEDARLITLIIVGKKSEQISPVLSEKQIEAERARPERLPLQNVAFLNRYTSEAEAQPPGQKARSSVVLPEV